MNTLTLDQFKTLAREIAPISRAVCLAQAFMELERARVDTYIRPIFDRYQFTYCGDLSEKCGLSGPLTDPKELYLCGDEDKVTAYYTECDAAHKAHGSTLAFGYCPALVAEHVLIEAENALIDSARDAFGIGIEHVHGDTRRQYLDLLIGAGIKAADDLHATTQPRNQRR